MSERLKIGDRVRIETWGTVEDIGDAHGLSYGVALDQRDYNPELDHFRYAWFDKDELVDRRAQDLTSEEVVALDRINRELKIAKFRHDNGQDRSGYLDHYGLVIAALDKLIAGSGK